MVTLYENGKFHYLYISETLRDWFKNHINYVFKIISDKEFIIQKNYNLDIKGYNFHANKSINMYVEPLRHCIKGNYTLDEDESNEDKLVFYMD